MQAVWVEIFLGSSCDAFHLYRIPMYTRFLTHHENHYVTMKIYEIKSRGRSGFLCGVNMGMAGMAGMAGMGY